MHIGDVNQPWLGRVRDLAPLRLAADLRLGFPADLAVEGDSETVDGRYKSYPPAELGVLIFGQWRCPDAGERGTDKGPK